MVDYDNQQLGTEFFRAISVKQNATGRGITHYQKTAKAIREAEVGIQELYVRDGNLKKLKIPGVGLKSVAILENILEKGAEVANEDFASEGRHKQIQGTRTGRKDIADLGKGKNLGNSQFKYRG
jgi:hypothetical protein